jgi:putative sterol carrier protein/multimeric flavodoxin WrbA
MKILYIYGNQNHYDHGLNTLITRTGEVFKELGAETETVDLGVLHPPYYDGETTTALDGVMEKIKTADGVVFATTAQMFAPTALLLSLLEYLEHPDYSAVLTAKHCMLVALSRAGGEKSALDFLSRVIAHNGGYVISQIGLQVAHLNALDGDTGDFVDKMTESFYRAAHQHRKYIIPSDFAPSGTQTETPRTVIVKETELVAEKTAPKQLAAFSETQEQEIEELSQLFSKKYTNSSEPKTPAMPDAKQLDQLLTKSSKAEFLPEKPLTDTKQKSNTALTLTKSLPDRFQSQLSAGLQAVVQINITGDETFDGFLYIHSTECTFTDGTAPAPDIIIMADTDIWLDVLSGKSTAQKAFMIGGIKSAKTTSFLM